MAVHPRRDDGMPAAPPSRDWNDDRLLLTAGAWIVALAAILVTRLCGIVTALPIFTAGVPDICWISLGQFTAAALGGVYLLIQCTD